MGSGLVSPWHIAIFALVVLLVFGPKKLPEMGRSLGKGMREFKDSITHHHEQLDEPPATEAPRAIKSTRDRDTIQRLAHYIAILPGCFTPPPVAADQSPLRAELDHVGASFRKAGAVPLAALPGDAGVQAVWRALGAL